MDNENKEDRVVAIIEELQNSNDFIFISGEDNKAVLLMDGMSEELELKITGLLLKNTGFRKLIYNSLQRYEYIIELQSKLN